jgi:hypothetical protein
MDKQSSEGKRSNSFLDLLTKLQAPGIRRSPLCQES